MPVTVRLTSLALISSLSFGLLCLFLWHLSGKVGKRASDLTWLRSIPDTLLKSIPLIFFPMSEMATFMPPFLQAISLKAILEFSLPLSPTSNLTASLLDSADLKYNLSCLSQPDSVQSVLTQQLEWCFWNTGSGYSYMQNLSLIAESLVTCYKMAPGGAFSRSPNR